MERDCKRCDGTGTRAAIVADGREIFGARACYSCDGAGRLPAPELGDILKRIGGRKGLRAGLSSTGAAGKGAAELLRHRRAYYVWRLARFHGGADVTMPITAETLIDGDPFRPELEALSEAVARKVYGSAMAGAYRWAGALGGVSAPAGLPPSAYSGGPVLLDDNDPEAAALLELERRDIETEGDAGDRALAGGRLF